MSAFFHRQPRPFYMIFLLEIWERFGFYTVQGVLVLYFIRFLGFTEITAYQTFGAFFALVYSLVAVGGYLGDQILGTKRTILLGLWILALGYLALTFLPSSQIYYALGLICVGNGLFKANPSNLLAKCYDQKRDAVTLEAGFTLYYMAINIGAIAALLIGPFIAARFGYAYTFFISSCGIGLGLLNYFLQRHTVAHINNTADLKRCSLLKWCSILVLVGLLTALASYLLQHITLTKRLLTVMISIFIAIYGFYLIREAGTARRRMVLALILMLEAILFFTLYQQMPTSINLFAVNNVNPHLFGIALDPQSFQVLNPVWIIIMSPILARFYTYLAEKNISFAIPYKFAAGMFFGGLGFLVLYCARFAADEHGMVSSAWLVGSYWFQSISELLISALGVAMVAEFVPARITGFVMGVWFLTSAVAGFTGASVASLTALPVNAVPGMGSLYEYTQVFAYIGLVVITIAIILGLLAPFLQRLTR